MSNAWAAASDLAIRSLPGALTSCSACPPPRQARVYCDDAGDPRGQIRGELCVHPALDLTGQRHRAVVDGDRDLARVEPQRRAQDVLLDLGLISASERANARTRSARVTMPTSLPCSTDRQPVHPLVEHQRGRGGRARCGPIVSGGIVIASPTSRGLELQLAVDPVPLEQSARAALGAPSGRAP